MERKIWNGKPLASSLLDGRDASGPGCGGAASVSGTMAFAMRLALISPTLFARLPRHPVRRGAMRRLVATGTLLAFTWLMLVASTHFHDQQAADDDCAVCSAVVHQATSSPTPATLAAAVFVVLYPVAPPAGCSAEYVSHRVAPPICGPPIA